MKFVKTPKEGACEASRCKVTEGLTIVDVPDRGNTALCARHLAQYQGGGDSLAVPDEARTFGMEGMFRQLGIYSPVGQLYTPEDAGSIMYYREDKKGQILQEGINEAGAFTSFSNFLSVEGINGNYGGVAWVYHRSQQPCRRCQTPIQRIKLAGRSAHFCPQCQR